MNPCIRDIVDMNSEQKKLLKNILLRYEEAALSPQPFVNSNISDLECAIRTIYRLNGQDEDVRIIYTSSPLIGAMAANIAATAWWLTDNRAEMKRDFIDHEYSVQIRDRFFNSNDKLSEEMYDLYVSRQDPWGQTEFLGYQNRNNSTGSQFDYNSIMKVRDELKLVEAFRSRNTTLSLNEYGADLFPHFVRKPLHNGSERCAGRNGHVVFDKTTLKNGMKKAGEALGSGILSGNRAKLERRFEPVEKYTHMPDIPDGVGIERTLELLQQAKIKVKPWKGSTYSRRPVFENYNWFEWANPYKMQTALNQDLDHTSHHILAFSASAQYNMDSGSYVSFHMQLAQDLVNIEMTELSKAEAIVSSYGCLRWQHDKFCIISENPLFIKTNANNQLHCANGPAIAWADGLELHYVNGQKADYRTFEPTGMW